jgi:hypothetical protein
MEKRNGSIKYWLKNPLLKNPPLLLVPDWEEHADNNRVVNDNKITVKIAEHLIFIFPPEMFYMMPWI